MAENYGKNNLGLGRLQRLRSSRQRLSSGQTYTGDQLIEQLRAPQFGELDPYALQDIENIRARTRLAIAEQQQARLANEAEAEQERVALRRDRSIIEMANQLGIQGVNNEYATLPPQIQGLGQQSQADYGLSGTRILDAYQSGQQQLPSDQTAQALEQQLAALTGGQTDGLAAAIQSPVVDMQSLLASSGQASQGNISTLGQGEYSAIQGMLPGFEHERGQTVQMQQLQTDAAVNEILNQLSQVQPEFLPFNYGELMLNEQENINAVIRNAFEMAKSEYEQQRQLETERTRYTGQEGAMQYAQSIGRPDLYEQLSQWIGDAGAAGLPIESIYGLIAERGNPSPVGLDNFDAAIEAIKPKTHTGIASDIIQAFSLGRPNVNQDRADAFRTLVEGLTNVRGAVEQTNARTARTPAAPAQELEELRRLLNIYMGSWASYA